MKHRPDLPTLLKLALSIGACAVIAISTASAQTRFDPAEPAREERVPITDPYLLERYGFEPDADNVYATPQAYAQMMMGPAQRAAAQAATTEARREAIRAESSSPFGTVADGRPRGVRYDLLSVVAIDGLQRQQRELMDLRFRLAALEAGATGGDTPEPPPSVDSRPTDLLDDGATPGALPRLESLQFERDRGGGPCRPGGGRVRPDRRALLPGTAEIVRYRAEGDQP